ncbi:hypothetical protein C8R43DRAFT_941169 [Mycena crocata]|nr:hypothetical protein C8R43DRAFT_941169 [Mycena crocata]
MSRHKLCVSSVDQSLRRKIWIDSDCNAGDMAKKADSSSGVMTMLESCSLSNTGRMTYRRISASWDSKKPFPRIHQTFDISIGALSGVAQHDNGPSKHHNATQQRDNGTTPERGAEKATTPTKSDVAVTRQLIGTEICCYKGEASIPVSHSNIPLHIFKHNIQLTVVDNDPSTTRNA